MTIGIGAAGYRAGLAVFAALAAAERVASGAIGGFAVFAAIDEDGQLHRAETQRGGTTTLFTEGERTGAPPPAAVAEAPYAAVMSSGPDRPAPLSQFLAAAPAVGLVTGHRLPNGTGREGIALNQAVLNRIARGMDAESALNEVLVAEPDADAGMIALGPSCGIAALNSALVARRYDLGHAAASSPCGAAVEVIHNAILPSRSLAPLIADIALSIMAPARPALGEITVSAGTPVRHGDADRVSVDETGNAVLVETVNSRLVEGRHNCAAIYLGSSVMRDGKIIGVTLMEPNVIVDAGRIVSLSGQTSVAIAYGATNLEVGDGDAS